MKTWSLDHNPCSWTRATQWSVGMALSQSRVWITPDQEPGADFLHAPHWYEGAIWDVDLHRWPSAQ